MKETAGVRRYAALVGAAMLWLLVLMVVLWVVAVPVHAQGRAGGGGGGGRGGAAAEPDTAAPQEPVWSWDPTDPRIGLGRGGEAARGMQLLANSPRPEGFATNTDLAFSGNLLFLGNYNGFNVYDISDPRSPAIRVSVLCPGSQGDVSFYRGLLFKSVEAARGRLDCGTEAPEGDVSTERFRGVRIFDLNDHANPKQVAAIQTCRGSHTHSLVTDPRDPDVVYVYVSGTSGVRPGEELPGCSGLPPEEDPNTSNFQIEVIRVPLDAPQDARIVSEPRVFADPQSGNIAALRGLTRENRPSDSPVRACHDITSYPAIGLAGGACSGNGLLLDIRDPVNPVRLDEVADANFSYWHSATFNNDGTRVVFTDEWGGGGSPRCRPIDPPNWGGNAIFDVDNGELRHRSYYKLPVPKQETCVAHNGNLIPVPGRDIMVQAWYQGGISVYDFTDPSNPHEIAFFDKGPGGGYWSAYWHNGYVYGAGMSRGLDVIGLTPSDQLSQNEIDAAMSVLLGEYNPQHQPKLRWPVSFAVTRSYVDQLARAGAIETGALARLRGQLEQAERLPAGNQRSSTADLLVATAEDLDDSALAELVAGRTGVPTRTRVLLAASLRELAATLR